MAWLLGEWSSPSVERASLRFHRERLRTLDAAIPPAIQRFAGAATEAGRELGSLQDAMERYRAAEARLQPPARPQPSPTIRMPPVPPAISDTVSTPVTRFRAELIKEGLTPVQANTQIQGAIRFQQFFDEELTKRNRPAEGTPAFVTARKTAESRLDDEMGALLKATSPEPGRFMRGVQRALETAAAITPTREDVGLPPLSKEQRETLRGIPVVGPEVEREVEFLASPLGLLWTAMFPSFTARVGVAGIAAGAGAGLAGAPEETRALVQVGGALATGLALGGLPLARWAMTRPRAIEIAHRLGIRFKMAIDELPVRTAARNVQVYDQTAGRWVTVGTMKQARADIRSGFAQERPRPVPPTPPPPQPTGPGLLPTGGEPARAGAAVGAAVGPPQPPPSGRFVLTDGLPAAAEIERAIAAATGRLSNLRTRGVKGAKGQQQLAVVQADLAAAQAQRDVTAILQSDQDPLDQLAAVQRLEDDVTDALTRLEQVKPRADRSELALLAAEESQLNARFTVLRNFLRSAKFESAPEVRAAEPTVKQAEFTPEGEVVVRDTFATEAERAGFRPEQGALPIEAPPAPTERAALERAAAPPEGGRLTNDLPSTAALDRRLSKLDADLAKPRVKGGRKPLMVERAKVQAQKDIDDILKSGTPVEEQLDNINRELTDLQQELQIRSVPFRGRRTFRGFVPSKGIEGGARRGGTTTLPSDRFPGVSSSALNARERVFREFSESARFEPGARPVEAVAPPPTRPAPPPPAAPATGPLRGGEPAPGFIRLYRGQRSPQRPIPLDSPLLERERGRAFTTRKSVAETYGPSVTFVDIPKSTFKRLRAAEEALFKEFPDLPRTEGTLLLPAELANQARPLGTALPTPRPPAPAPPAAKAPAAPEAGPPPPPIAAVPLRAAPSRALPGPRGLILPPPVRALVPVEMAGKDFVAQPSFTDAITLAELLRVSQEMRAPRVILLPPANAPQEVRDALRFRLGSFPQQTPGGARQWNLTTRAEVIGDAGAAAQNWVRVSSMAPGGVPPMDPPQGPPWGGGDLFPEFNAIPVDLPWGATKRLISFLNEQHRFGTALSNSINSAIGDALRARVRMIFRMEGPRFKEGYLAPRREGASLDAHDVLQRPNDYVWPTAEARELADYLPQVVKWKRLQVEDEGIVVPTFKLEPGEVYFPRTVVSFEGEAIRGAGRPRRGIGAKQTYQLPRVNEFAEQTRAHGRELLDNPADEVEAVLKGMDRTILDSRFSEAVKGLGQTPNQRVARVYKEAVIEATRRRNGARAALNRLQRQALSRAPERDPNIKALRALERRIETRLLNARVNAAKAKKSETVERWKNQESTLIEARADIKKRIADALKEGRTGLKTQIAEAESRLGGWQERLRAAKADKARQIDIARRPRAPTERRILEPFATGRIFPREVAIRVERGIRPAQMGPLLPVLGAMAEISSIFRPLMAAGDLSYTALQTATGAGLNPAAYAKMQGVVLSSLLDPTNYYLYVDANLPVIVEAIRHNMPWGGHEFTFEEALSGPIGPILQPVIRYTGLKMGNDAFTRALNVITVEHYKQGRAVALGIGESNFSKLVRAEFGPVAKGETGLDQLGAVVANMSGRLSLKAGAKVGPTQALFMRALLFAGRYYTAWISLVAKATKLHGLDANIGRRALLTFVGGLAGIYWLVGQAIGQEPNFDPGSGKFMTYRIAGQNIGPGGILYGFIRLGDKLLDDPLNAPAVAARYFRGRASPAVSNLWDAATQQTFIYQDLDSPEDWALWVATLPLPFAARGALEAAVREGAGVAGIAATFASEFLGGRAFPQSPFQRRDDLAADWARANNVRDEEGNVVTKYRDLDRDQRSAFNDSELGKRATELVARSALGAETRETLDAIQGLRESIVSDPEVAQAFRLTTTQAQDNALLDRREIDGAEWRGRLSERQDAVANVRTTFEQLPEELKKRLEIDFEFEEPEPQSVDWYTERYFAVTPSNFIDDKGEIDWERYFTKKDSSFDMAVRAGERRGPGGGQMVQGFLRPFEEDATIRDFRRAQELRTELDTKPKYEGLGADEAEIVDEFLVESRQLLDRWFRDTGTTYPLRLAIRSLGEYKQRVEPPPSGWRWDYVAGWADVLRPATRTREGLVDPAQDNFIIANSDLLLRFFPELSNRLSRPQIAGLEEEEFETALERR